MSTNPTFPLEPSPGSLPLTLDTLPLGQLTALDEVQQRVGLSDEKVTEYAGLYREGRDLGRLVVFTDGGIFLLADGFHRLRAAALAALTAVPVEVHPGTRRDAALFAASCNLHGKELSNADKHRRVTTLLQDPEWGQWSDNAIAKHCGVAHSFVSRLRDRLSLDSESSDDDEPMPTTRTYRDRYGQVRTMDTSKIGQKAPETPPDPRPELALGSPQGQAPAVSTLPTSTGTSSTGSTTAHRPDVVPDAGPPTNGQALPAARGTPEADTLGTILAQLGQTFKALYWCVCPHGWIVLDQALSDALAQHPSSCRALGKDWRRFEAILSTSEAFRRALEAANPAPEPPASPPEPTPVAPGTIAAQICAVLRDAHGGMSNAQIAKAINKKQTDTFRPLERLVRHGKARKEHTTYFSVAQKETP